MPETELAYAGHAGRIVGRRWEGARTDYVVLLVHGYGEHSGRYQHVARRLVEDGAVVYAVDHVGHGRSEGEPVLITDLEKVCDDLRLMEGRARQEHPTLPVVLVGHSMGGLIAARYAQRHGDGLAAVVLSAPVLGRWDALDGLLAFDEIPDVPIDPDVLSRDPSVGAAYAADEFVWHGAFKRPTLEALKRALAAVDRGGAVELPVLWLHGDADQLVPIGPTRDGFAVLGGAQASSTTYPGARHEIFNETNRDEVLDDVVSFLHRHIHATR